MTLTTTAYADRRVVPVSARVESEPVTASPGVLRRGAAIAGDLLLLLAVVWSIPLVILAITMPLALCLRLVSWVFGRL